MTRIHETVSGHRIEYEDPDAKLERFLKRVRALLDDQGKTENDMVALIYGRENPILDHSVFAERGAVTKSVLENPVYHVLTDLLTRKRIAQDGIDVGRMSAPYTATVSDAASELGISGDAVRKAIRDRRLPAWVKEGVYYMDPRTYPALGVVGRRGLARKSPLECVVGLSRPSTSSLRVKTDRGEEWPKDKATNSATVTVERWRRAAVLTGGYGKLRMFVIEPAETVVDEITFDGFSVRGTFRVVEKVNNVKAAKAAWESFGV